MNEFNKEDHTEESGTHKKYKPGQLVTINHRVYRITKKIYMHE